MTRGMRLDHPAVLGALLRKARIRRREHERYYGETTAQAHGVRDRAISTLVGRLTPATNTKYTRYEVRAVYKQLKAIHLKWELPFNHTIPEPFRMRQVQEPAGTDASESAPLRTRAFVYRGYCSCKEGPMQCKNSRCSCFRNKSKCNEKCHKVKKTKCSNCPAE